MDVLLNWLWQGFVIAVAAAAVLRVISPSRTQARYGVAWIGCALVIALPVLPWLWPSAAPAGTLEATAIVTGPVVKLPPISPSVPVCGLRSPAKVGLPVNGS